MQCQDNQSRLVANNVGLNAYSLNQVQVPKAIHSFIHSFIQPIGIYSFCVFKHPPELTWHASARARPHPWI